MVVKSATKKKLMDSGWSEPAAHEMAKDRRWDDVKKLSPSEIEGILIDASIPAPYIPNTTTGRPLSIYDWWLTTKGTWRFKKTSEGYDFEFTFKGDDYKYSWLRKSGQVIEKEMLFEGLGSLFGGKGPADWWSWEELALGKLNPHFDGVEISQIIKDMDGKQNILHEVVTKVENGNYHNYDAWFPESINRVDVLDVFVPVERCRHGVDRRKDCDQCGGFDDLASLFG